MTTAADQKEARYKLTVYVPAGHLSALKKALFDAGAGVQGNYQHCCWQTLGTGQFRPGAGSSPTIGEVGKLESVPEYRVEMLCAGSARDAVTRALQANHPYEEPAFDWLRLCD